MSGSITKENFNQLLGRFSTGELENLIEKHPYFQQAHILLAKKYQQENNPKFDEQLQLAALYSQDREFLYSIFNGRDNETPPLFVSPPISETEVAVVDEKLFEPITEDLIVEDVNTFSPEWKVETKVAEETDVVSQIQDEEIRIEEQPQEEIVTEEIISTKTDEETPPPVVERLEEEVVMEAEEPVSREQVKEEVKETFVTSQPHTFDEWLSAFTAPETPKLEFKQEQISPEPEKQEDELEQLIMSNLQVQGLVEEEAHYSRGLDTFIEEQKQKHKPHETLKPADENELAPELITETMAKVYEMQKKYPKAIRAYEILTLKYPEKNDFFAARINYLKNII